MREETIERNGNRAKGREGKACHPSLEHTESPVDEEGARPTPVTAEIVTKIIAEEIGSGARAERYVTCGTWWSCFRRKDHPEVYVWIRTACRDRLCPACQHRRAATIRDNLIPIVKRKMTRFVTLTLRQEPGRTLPETLKRLYQAFRRLRQRAFWKRSVTGGAAFCEVKRNEGLGAWNCHLHVLVQGDYMDQAILSKEWLAATGNSSIVDIRLVRGESQMIRYVTKYVTKFSAYGHFADENLVREYINGLKDVKQVITFGEWRKERLTVKRKHEEITFVGSEATIERRAREGDEVARTLLIVLSMTRVNERVNMIEVIPKEDQGNPILYETRHSETPCLDEWWKSI